MNTRIGKAIYATACFFKLLAKAMFWLANEYDYQMPRLGRRAKWLAEDIGNWFVDTTVYLTENVPCWIGNARDFLATRIIGTVLPLFLLLLMGGSIALQKGRMAKTGFMRAWAFRSMIIAEGKEEW